MSDILSPYQKGVENQLAPNRVMPTNPNEGSVDFLKDPARAAVKYVCRQVFLLSSDFDQSSRPTPHLTLTAKGPEARWSS
jgi:hypothetical protein